MNATRHQLAPILVRIAFAMGLMSALRPSLASPGTRGAADGRPIARIKESVICCPGEMIELDGWASIDVGGEVAEWLWDFTEDGEPDTVSPTGEMIVSAPATSHSYSIVLTVRDNEGNLSVPDTSTVFVMEVRPQITMRSDTCIKVGVRVPFRPTVKWVCGTPSQYEWDFDNDGTVEYQSSSNGNTSRVYYTPGRYVARFNVVDTHGNASGAITRIRVTGAQPRGDISPPGQSRNRTESTEPDK